MLFFKKMFLLLYIQLEVNLSKLTDGFFLISI